MRKELCPSYCSARCQAGQQLCRRVCSWYLQHTERRIVSISEQMHDPSCGSGTGVGSGISLGPITQQMSTYAVDPPRSACLCAMTPSSDQHTPHMRNCL